jgi:hypothetical protein
MASYIPEKEAGNKPGMIRSHLGSLPGQYLIDIGAGAAKGSFEVELDLGKHSFTDSKISP